MNPIPRPRLPRFLRSERGSLTIVAALCVTPIIGMLTFNAELIRYQQLQTRLHQAQGGAALAWAKEGPDANGSAAQALAARFLDYNLTALGPEARRAAEPLLTDGGTQTVAVRHDARALFEPVARRVLPPIDQAVRAERFYRKTEIALVLDTSSSMTSPVNAVQAVRDGVVGYINQSFRNQQTSDDTWISLIGYSGMVNVGWDYKDRLVTPASRLAPESLRTVAELYGWSATMDLLSSNGPEGLRRGACVQRRPLAKGNEVAYAASLETPPASAAEGFNLKVEYGTSTLSTRYLAQTTKLDLLTQIGLQVPPGDTNDLRGVGAAYECSFMPMLIASNQRDELLQRIALYLPTSTTGGDEGLAWALRALSPNWRSVWNRGEAPSDYSDAVDKKVVLFSDGFNNVGYGGYPTSQPDAIPAICNRMRAQGVEVSVVLFNNSGSFLLGPAKKDYENCATDADHVHNTGAITDIIQILLNLGKRQYRVRLAG